MARVTGVRALPSIGLVFVCLGLLGLIAAGVPGWLEMNGSRQARANGVIVDFAVGPVVEYTTGQGAVVRFRSAVRSTTFALGQSVPVAYDPADPADAAIDGFIGRWFLPGLFAMIFGVFLVIGLILSVVGRILRPRPA